MTSNSEKEHTAARDRRRSALLRWALPAALGLAGLAFLGSGGYIQAKAWLAQQLLEQSWIAIKSGARDARPWPWADTRPVGRLRVPRLQVSRLVLSGASGRNLAFGPTHVAPSSLPGADGHVVISGHRDTHFRFLSALVTGDTIDLESRDGTVRRYRVHTTGILDTRERMLALSPESSQLTLVTCFPFDSPVTGTPLRYLVHATAVDSLFTPG